MKRRTPQWLIDQERAQEVCKNKILNTISRCGLLAAEYQLKFLIDHPRTMLPSTLNHKETVRIYQLTITEYKNKLNESNS